jgi:FkbM family methyltransferase
MFKLTPFDEKVNKYYHKSIIGVLHVGAHEGHEYDCYKNMNIPNILFFEPLMKSFNVLKNKVPEGMAVQLAVGNENKELEMFVSDRNGGMSSSVLKPKKHLNLYPHITFNQREKVKMIRLDDYIINKYYYNAMNIDVQGYELEVLKGAKELLNYIDVINLEVNNDELYEGCPHYTEIEDFLLQYGFQQKLIEWWDNTLPWGDGFYVKEKK